MRTPSFTGVQKKTTWVNRSVAVCICGYIEIYNYKSPVHMCRKCGSTFKYKHKAIKRGHMGKLILREPEIHSYPYYRRRYPPIGLPRGRLTV